MPSIETLLTFTLAGVVLVVIPGPSVLFIVGRALAHGRRAALTSVAGNTTGAMVIVVAVALGVGAGVAVAGTIGFVGLVVPHLLRLLTGPNHRTLLPASALLGGTLLVLADLASRTIAMPAEVPIGIVTALLGAPFFLYLLRQGRGGLSA